MRRSRRRGVISPGSLPAALGARPSAVRSRFPGLWREARSPPRPFLALYLDAAVHSWDLTFLHLRRPRDPRQGALRASAGKGREDARSAVLGEWVEVRVRRARPGGSCSNFTEAEGGGGVDMLT